VADPTREEKLAKRRAYNLRTREKRLAVSRAYYHRTKERDRPRWAERRRENRIVARDRARRWREESLARDPEGFKERRNSSSRLSKRRFRAEDPEGYRLKARRYRLKKYYGLTEEEYKTLLAKQDGVCALCGRPPESERQLWFAVDHDHQTGKIRGLLHNGCNLGLAFFGEDPAWLRLGAEYLERHRGQ